MDQSATGTISETGLPIRGIGKIVPLARTKWDAEQAEIKAKQELFEKRYGVEEKGTDLLSEFLDQVYLPWSKTNKKSWRDDSYTIPMLKRYFEGKALREISAQMVEKFKNDRLNTQTKKETTGDRQQLIES